MIDNKKGFTLVELMITLVVATIIVMAIYASYIIQQKSYYAQSDIIEMQQNIRAALEVMVRDLRMAGYDPDETGRSGFKIQPTSGSSYSGATSTSVTFSMDIVDDGSGNPGNGYVTEAGETINFRLYTSNGKQNLGRHDINSGGNISAVAENIELLRFRYQLANGTWQTDVLPGNTNEIRTVQIIIIARANQPTANFVSGTYQTPVGNFTYTDSYHRRLMVTSVNCRNMGI